MRLLKLLFGLSERVTRTQYVVTGLLLAAVKFGIDTAIVRSTTGKTWSPLGYLIPSLILRTDAAGSLPDWANLALAFSTLPFLWIGVSMSVRRAADAGVSPWWGLWFLVPVFHYVQIAVLCFLPTSTRAVWEQAQSTYRGPVHARGHAGDQPVDVPAPRPIPHAFRAAIIGASAAFAIGLVACLLSIYALKQYGAALFIVTPFAMGATAATVYSRQNPRGAAAGAVAVALLALVMTGASLLLFAVEGVICILMAAPPAAMMIALGALLAHHIVRQSRSGSASYGAFLLVIPAAAGVGMKNEPTLREVTTVVEIDAPPERVWPNVVHFTELPPPSELVFKLGVAYPMRARIHGEGVGAVRRCEFSTGAFVEPITVWDPPNRLAFDVTAEPPSMHEWSPYREINAPHLNGYLSSKGGEFRLERIEGNRTRLSGTTHYTLRIYPELYWALPTELLLHGIHRRVLEHIRTLTE